MDICFCDTSADKYGLICLVYYDMPLNEISEELDGISRVLPNLRTRFESYIYKKL